jgi:hypothetical protein
MARLNHYKLCTQAEKDAFADCCAHFAYLIHSHLVEAPAIDHTKHPYFRRWCNIRPPLLDDENLRSVPLFRAMVQQYKIDKYRGTPSSVTEEQFARALSVRSVKAPELRRRVRAALKPFGYSRVDALGDYHCHQVDRDFSVNVDFGGRSAQLRYYVSFPEFQQVRHLNRFGFEHALGFGFQDWDFIVEENVDDVFALFTEVVAYSVELPERIRRSVQ